MAKERTYFIYKYTFPNGKVYIGQTYKGSSRFGNPKKYKGTLVGNALLKYPDYQKEILEYCTPNDVDERERFYIGFYNSTNRAKGYNRDTGGNESKVLTDDLKKELSRVHKGLQVSKIEQYTVDGVLIKEWNSIKEASEYLGVDRSSISHALHNDIPTAGGYKWKLKEKYSPLIYRQIEQYSLDGEYIRSWSNYEEAENELKLHNILSALNGRNRTCGGFQWKYKDSKKEIKPYKTARVYEGKHIYQYDLQGNYIREWQSSYDASHELKIPHQHIDRVLNGTRKMTRGYVFTYDKVSKIQKYDANSKAFYHPVLQYTLDNKFIKEWPTIKSAQDALGITSGIGGCCRGLQKSAGGYKWKYKVD